MNVDFSLAGKMRYTVDSVDMALCFQKAEPHMMCLDSHHPFESHHKKCEETYHPWRSACDEWIMKRQVLDRFMSNRDRFLFTQKKLDEINIERYL